MLRKDYFYEYPVDYQLSILYYYHGSPRMNSYKHGRTWIYRNTAAVVSYVEQFTSGTIVLGRLIGSSLVESFTNSYTLTDPNGTEEKYT